MASVNKVILVGNLGRDPETRTFPSGDQVCNVSLATTDRWKDKQTGEQREATEWHRLVFNGRLAEIAAQYLRKGSQIYIEGAIRTRKYTDKDGVEKYTTDIRVDQMQMLGTRQGQQGAGADDGYGDGGGYQRPAQTQRQQPNGYAQARGVAQPQGQRRPPPTQGNGGFDDMDDDIPF